MFVPECRPREKKEVGCGFVFTLGLKKTPKISLVVSHTRLCVWGKKKTASLLIQSSLSQSVKAAQITKTVIQLKLIRLKKQNWWATSTSWLPGTKTASSEGEKNTVQTDWYPPPHFTFPRSFSDAIVPFRLTLTESLIKQSRWPLLYFQLHRLLVWNERKRKHWGN